MERSLAHAVASVFSGAAHQRRDPAGVSHPASQDLAAAKGPATGAGGIGDFGAGQSPVLFGDVYPRVFTGRAVRCGAADSFGGRGDRPAVWPFLPDAGGNLRLLPRDLA